MILDLINNTMNANEEDLRQRNDELRRRIEEIESK
jgi:hypothetical protein